MLEAPPPIAMGVSSFMFKKYLIKYKPKTEYMFYVLIVVWYLIMTRPKYTEYHQETPSCNHFGLKNHYRGGSPPLHVESFSRNRCRTPFSFAYAGRHREIPWKEPIPAVSDAGSNDDSVGVQDVSLLLNVKHPKKMECGGSRFVYCCGDSIHPLMESMMEPLLVDTWVG